MKKKRIGPYEVDSFKELMVVDIQGTRPRTLVDLGRIVRIVPSDEGTTKKFMSFLEKQGVSYYLGSERDCRKNEHEIDLNLIYVKDNS